MLALDVESPPPRPQSAIQPAKHIGLILEESKLASSAVQQPHNDGERRDIIVLNNVHKTYLLGVEGVPALRGVSVKIKEGEFVVVLGTSGGGKTTLLNIIGTIDKPTKGDVWINGIRIKSSTDDKLLANLRLNYLAFVFQTFNLIGSLTALENVELPMILMVPKTSLRTSRDLGWPCSR